MEQVLLTARIREERGKEAARRLRKQGFIPAVLYGGKNGGTSSLPLALSYKEVLSILKDEMGANAVLRLKLEGTKEKDERNVIFREIQTHPIRHDILHIDLYEVAMDKQLHVEIPIELIGEAVGVKEQGGILEHNLRSLNIECLPGQIPEHVQVDVSQLNLGKPIHVADLQLSEDITVLDDPARVVASVIEKPTERVEEVVVVEVEEEAAAAPAEEQQKQTPAPEEKSKEQE